MLAKQRSDVFLLPVCFFPILKLTALLSHHLQRSTLSRRVVTRSSGQDKAVETMDVAPLGETKEIDSRP
jgi:hypothetical protein